MAIWLPAQPSPDNIGKFQVQEATSLLEKLSESVEKFQGEHDRTPDVKELVGLEISGEYVVSLTGNNPYFANMKNDGVYEDIAGKSLGWKYDPETEMWEKCFTGTVSLRFRSLECRRK